MNSTENLAMIFSSPKKFLLSILIVPMILFNWNLDFNFLFISLDTIIFFGLAFLLILTILLHGKLSKYVFIYIFLFALAFLSATVGSSVLNYSAAKSFQIICALFVGIMLADEFYKIAEHYLLFFLVVCIAFLLRYTDLLLINVTTYRIFLLLLQVSLCSLFERKILLQISLMIPIIGLMLLENSKGLIIAATVPVLIVFFKNRRSLKRFIPLLTIVILITISYLVNTEIVVGRISDILSPFASGSSLPRITLAYSGLLAFINNPIYGVGIGAMNHPDVFMEYYQSEVIYLYAQSSEIVQHDMIFMGRTSGVHNMYIDILASGGIILGSVFSLYLWKAFKSTREFNTKKLFMIAFLVYAMSWQFFTSAIGAFIIGTFYNKRSLDVRE